MKITEIMPSAASAIDWHLRVFLVREEVLCRGEWPALDVCSPYWRFYANDRDGMEMKLLDDPSKSGFSLEKNRFYFVPPGVRFSGQISNLVHHFYIHFDVLGAPPLLFPTFREQLLRPFEIANSSTSKTLCSMVDELRVLALEGEAAPNASLSLRAKSLLFEAFALCVERWPAMPTGDLQWVRPALEYIESHLCDTLTNARLAELCHFSSDHFIVRFRAAIGQTPAQYVLGRRLSVASQRLLFSDESIEQVATQTGFCDRFHFSRAFKIRFGVSPASYRKKRLI